MADKLKHEGPEIFRLLVDSIKDYAIYLLDEKGFVKSWNVGGERIKGFSAAEIIGKHYSVFFTPEDVKAGRPERELELARAEGRYEEEAWRVRKDGSRFWASIVLTSLVDDQNRHVGFAKLTRDLTERKKAEETIREQNAELKATDEQLRRALEEREDFISVASHELKTPLTALSMQIESFDKTLRGALKTVESSGGQARRLSELLNELLDLTRI
ncbi:MAG: PAS domain S-box protein, partial [Bdellovibrionota bacterium]